MPGLGNPDDSGTLTPGRRTIVKFDVTDHVAVEAPWHITRSRYNIHGFDYTGDPTERILRLSSGALGIEPLGDSPSDLHELATGEPNQIRLTDVNGEPNLVEVPLFKRPDTATMPGVLDDASPDLQSSGDYFFTLRRPAGSNWNSGLLNALPLPPPPKALALQPENLAVDLIAESTATYLPDQGFLLRFRSPGTNLTAVDRMLHIEFGGPLTAEGHGRFALVFSSNGYVMLSELVNGVWEPLEEHQYASKKDVAHQGHSIRIIPHARRYLEVQSGIQSTAYPGFWQNWTTHSWGPAQIAADSWAHYVSDRIMALKSGEGETNPNGQFVTGPGNIRIFTRRDLRLFVQVSRLTYPQGGVLLDHPVVFPFGSEAGFTFQLEWYGPQGVAGGGPLLSFEARNQLNGNLLPYTLAGGWELPGGENRIVPKFYFTPSGNEVWSPYLLAYQLRKPSVNVTNVPGELVAPSPESIELRYQGNRPDTEGGALSLVDKNDALTRLRHRGRMTVQVDVELDGGPETTTVFRGYVAGARARPRGRSGEWAPGKTLAYTNRYDYEIDLQGKWSRLAEQMSGPRTLFLHSPFIYLDTLTPAGVRMPSGAYEYPKLTDIIRTLLQEAGYPNGMIDIPDSDMRLVTTEGDRAESHTMGPWEGVGDWITRYAYDYMGMHFFFDANAGTLGGMWRLKQIEVADTPLFYFLTETPPTPAPAFVHHPGLWGANATFIERDSLRTRIDGPEANQVLVTTTGEYLPAHGSQLQNFAWATNPTSVNLPSFAPPQADPDAVGLNDYLGRLAGPVIRFDPFLAPQFIPLVLRRLYEATCFARRRYEFVAPFHPVADPTDAQLMGRRRPLRYGDTVAIGATVATAVKHLVLSCNPAWSGTWGDTRQRQYLETEEVRSFA